MEDLMKLTLYPNNSGYVSQDISVKLLKGLNQLVIDNIPLQIDKHSLIFSFQNASQTTVQNYELSEGENQESFSLIMLIESTDNGEYTFTFSYRINNISYNIFYNFLYDNLIGELSIYGWAEITNYSGKDFQSTELQIVTSEHNNNVIFTLDSTYNIINNKTINLSFLSKNGIHVNNKYIIPSDKDVAIECIAIQNTPEFQLGTPLMPGEVSVYFKDVDQNIQFMGSDKTSIYLPDEDIFFEIGNSDDLLQVTRQYSENGNLVNIKNTTKETMNVRLEINTYGKEIEQSNVVFTIDNNNVIYVDLKLTPLENLQVVYRLKDISPLSLL